MDSELEAEGFARELMRRIQEMRKKAGLTKADDIELKIRCDDDLIKKHSNLIKEKVGASNIEFMEEITNSNKEKFKIKGKEFEIGFEKV